MLYAFYLCMYGAALRPASFEEERHAVFVNRALSEVGVEMKKNKAGTSGIQGRGS